MAYGDDDKYHNDHGANYGGRAHYGNTSDLDTTSLSKDGRFLGIKISPEFESQLNTFYPVALGWLRRKAELLAVPVVTGFARKFTNEHTAERIGSVAGDTIGYSVILSKQLLNTGRNMYDSISSLNDVRSAVMPLQANGSTAPLSGDNEVVANARGRVSGLFWQGLFKEATSTVAAAPELYIKINEQMKANEGNRKLKDVVKAKEKGDTDALAKELYKQTTPGSVQHGVEGDAMRAAMDKALAMHAADNKQAYKQYQREHKKGIKKKLTSTLDSLTPENFGHKLETLKKQGFNVSYVERQLRGDSYSRPADKDVVLKNFVTYAKEQLDEVANKRVQQGFYKAHGDPSAKRQDVLKQLQGIDHSLSEQDGKVAHVNEEGDLLAKTGANLAAGFASEWIGGTFFGGKAQEKYQQPIALDRILHLRRTLEKGGEIPEMVPGLEGKDGHHEDPMSYTRFVHEIFQQHQRDSNRIEIGERFVANFDNAQWNDETIQNTSDNQLTAYEYAVKAIAQRIKSGRMDAIALIELVGDKQKKIVSDDGRSFGPRGKDEAAAKEAISKIIDEKTALLHAGQKQTAAEINDKLGNFVFSVDDLKTALQSDALGKDQRAFIFTLFSDVVGSDEGLCKKLSINMERCKELRGECKERFTSMLDGAVNLLADMIEQNPEALDKQLKLTDKEKELITAMAGQSRGDSKHIADAVKNRDELQILERTVANAAMTLGREKGVGEGEGFWQRLVTAVRPKKEADAVVEAPLEHPAVASTTEPAQPPVEAKPEVSHGARELSRKANKDASPDLGVSV